MVQTSTVQQNQLVSEQPNAAVSIGKQAFLQTTSDIVSGAIVGSAAGAAVASAILPISLTGTIIGAFLGGGLNAYLKKKNSEAANH